jgi:GNAT superfamily N-acetyltransferase
VVARSATVPDVRQRVVGRAQAAEAFERPHAQLDSLLECRIDLRKDDPGQRNEAFGAFEGDEMVGAAMTFLPLLDNTDLMWFMAFVEPERRRAGIGSLLVEHCVDRARELGRHSLMSDALSRGGPGGPSLPPLRRAPRLRVGHHRDRA